MQVTRQGWAVAVHGGAGNSKANEDGCIAAAKVAAASLGEGGPALDAVVDSVVRLEDDGRYNAGIGSDVGLDGQTFELDASVMDTRGTLGAVAAVRSVRNPVLLARAVGDTPHCLLVGEGADRFARLAGLPAYQHDTGKALARHRSTLQALTEFKPVLPKVPNERFAAYWNYPMPWQEALKRYGCGTVGAVARDSHGHFAVATSTGGSAPSLLGRVGDTPLVGCGFYCGRLGAIGATGIGEAIMREMLARTVYGWLAGGRGLQEALNAGVALFDPDIDVGLIGVTIDAVASASNRDMPVARMVAQ
jgi:beta-aspartyl-peptidase (threonine type)